MRLLFDTSFKCYDKHKKKSTHGLSTVEITIISSVILFLGIFLLYVANNWYLNSTLEANEEVGKSIQIIRSALIIEQIKYNYSANKADLVVRNVAKDDLTLKIFAVDLLSVDGRLHGHLSLSDFNYVLRRGDKLVIVGVPTCTECHRGDLLVYRVWYVAERYASDRHSMLKQATFTESSFIYAGGEPLLACPPFGDYVMVDIVDPILLTDGQFSGSNTVYIRPAIRPSSSPLNISLTVMVENLINGTRGYGTLGNIRVPSLEQIKIVGNFSGIKVPFKITIYSPDIEIIQREWIMSGIPNKVSVSGLSLLWRETDYTVHTLVLEITAPTLPEDVIIKVSVKIKDCLSNKLDEIEVRERIPSGMEVDLPIFIRLNKAVRFDQIYSLETEIVEVG